MPNKEKLADYVRRKLNDKEITYREFERRAGGIITKSALSRVLNDGLENVSMKVIAGIAQGLNEPVENVFRVAIAPYAPPPELGGDDNDFAALFYKYNRLSEEDKEDMRIFLEVVDNEIERRWKKKP